MVAKVMSRVFKKLGKEEKGFTLIELLAVIVILAVIAVIAIPMIGKVIDNSKTDANLATAKQIYDAARLYVIGEENGDFDNGGAGRTITIKSSVATDETLVSEGYLDANIALPSNKETISGGTVTFNTNGSLSGISINTTTQYSSTPLSYTPAQVLQQKVK